jgi:hypothetical protein
MQNTKQSWEYRKAMKTKIAEIEKVNIYASRLIIKSLTEQGLL